MTVNVPDEAIETAARVEYARDWTAPWGSREAAPFMDDYLHTARRMLTVGAPFIVDANQPEPLPALCRGGSCEEEGANCAAHGGQGLAWDEPSLPEIHCPQCGATIRARMADQADSDLHEALAKAYFLDELGIAVSNPEALWAEQGADSRAYYYAAVNHSASIAQAYVDSQVAAARADERAKAGVSGPPPPPVPDPARCGMCRHGWHDGACLNMASDNDCPCPTARTANVEADRD